MHCLRLYVDDLAKILATCIRCRLGRLRFLGFLSLELHLFIVVAIDVIARLSSLGSFGCLGRLGSLDILRLGGLLRGYLGSLSYGLGDAGLGNTAYCGN